jgi:hypothetical protein
MNADREAYWELEEEVWMQTGKHTWNCRKKGGCRQGSVLGTGGKGVDADREVYRELQEEHY